MTYTEARLSKWAEPVAALGLIVSLGTMGCSFTQTSSTIRAVPGAPSERLRLTREGLSVLSGDFHQEGHTVVAQLTLSNDCTTESNQVIARQQVTDTHTNRTTAIAWTIVGGMLTAVGTGLLVDSQSADTRVVCGSGDTVKAGDQCDSASSAESSAAVSTLVLGLTTALVGGFYLTRKPQIETTDLPVQQLTTVTTQVSCGASAALAGLGLALELPGNGKWSGRAEADGSLRININPQLALPDATLPIVVEEVPPSLAGLVAPGAVVGQLKLSNDRPDSAHRKLASRR
jgi:hypothetical protein